MHSLRNWGQSITNGNKKLIFISTLGAILLCFILVGSGLAANDIQLSEDNLVITGPHGISIPLARIDSIYLTNKRISAERIKGYSMGYRKKGLYRDSNGTNCHMFINSRALPWLVIQSNAGFKVYYSHSRKSADEVLREIKKTLPNTGYATFR